MVKRHGAAHCIGDSFMVAFVFHGHSVEVVGIREIAHGAERDIHFAVHVVVAILYDVFHHADDLVRNAVEPDFFAQRVLP